MFLEQIYEWSHRKMAERGMTMDELSMKLRLAKTTVYGRLNPFNDKQALQFVDVIALIDIFDDDEPLQWILQSRGKSIVPMCSNSERPLMMETLDVGSAAGELAHAVSDALIDGRVGKEEALAINRACMTLLRETGDVIAAVRDQ